MAGWMTAAVQPDAGSLTLNLGGAGGGEIGKAEPRSWWAVEASQRASRGRQWGRTPAAQPQSPPSPSQASASAPTPTPALALAHQPAMRPSGQAAWNRRFLLPLGWAQIWIAESHLIRLQSMQALAPSPVSVSSPRFHRSSSRRHTCKKRATVFHCFVEPPYD